MKNDIEIIDDCEQGDPAWIKHRVGVLTASDFADAIAAGEGKVRGLLMRKLAGEQVTGLPRENYRGGAMERGNIMEPMLRDIFTLETGLQTRQVAFIKRKMPWGVIGASPDSLVGDDCGVEFKSMAPHLLIDVLKADRMPPEHRAQVQGCMLVTGRKSWWFAAGYEGMPLFRQRIMRDPSYIARLEVGLQTFHEELGEMVAWLRGYGRG